MLSCNLSWNRGQTFVYFWYLKNYDYQEIETIILKVQTSDDHAVGLLYVLHGYYLRYKD